MSRPATPLLTTDAVIADPARGVVLIRRGNQPYAGRWALPGGFVDVGEDCESACVREAAEETGLVVAVRELLGVYSNPGRDPRGATASVVYLCEPIGGHLESGDDAAEARWFESLEPVQLAFDHRTILEDAGFLTTAPRP